MKQKRSTYYVTTPIYYPNAKPHLGHLYSTVLADVAARLHTILGQDIFLLTGTDEHGQKIAQAAQNEGITPQELVDRCMQEFKKVWETYHIDYSYFVRTTEPRHIQAVHYWIEKIKKQGDIYKGTYTGWYCIPCETFVGEKDQTGESLVCPSCQRQTVEVSEECYFFKLSAYQDKLLAFYEKHPEFILPQERAAEVVSFVKSGLKDLSISRTTVTWGIPFPNDEKHTIYVWADALNNYISAIGYGDPSRQKEFTRWWPADVHVLGKDILRFHAIYWPAFLMAAELPIPRHLLVHGWFKVGEQKMSKSLGNVLDPLVLADTYGVDAIRYYLVRYASIAHDSPFVIEELEKRINSDLANDLGNLVNRILSFALKQGMTTLSGPKKLGETEQELKKSFALMCEDFLKETDVYYFHRAYGHVWKFIHQLNAYLHAQEPWRLLKTQPQRCEEILCAALHGVYSVAILLWPVMPEKMERLFDALNQQRVTLQELLKSSWTESVTISPLPPLFERIEQQKEEQKPKSSSISFDEFASVELRIGEILECIPVPKSDKLYKLRVSFGDLGERIICAGIKTFFASDDLIGKKAVFVYNLAPRKLMGIESQGMILTVKNEDKLAIITVDSSIKNGTPLR